MQVAVQWIGLQRTNGTVISALYIQDCTSNPWLSIGDICAITGLSLSTVSTICSHLETHGIIVRQVDESKKKPGRRKTMLSLRLGVGELLSIGMKMNVGKIGRILEDIKLAKPGDAEDGSLAVLAKIEDEIETFLTSVLEKTEIQG